MSPNQGQLSPGGVIGDGRYRLLAQFGADEQAGALFWRARDNQLGRDVALSVLLGNPADRNAASQARRTLDRAMHSATFSHPTVSRVIDVLSLGNGISPSEGVLGMVVADWSPGTDLVDLVADGAVRPNTAAALLEPLTSAVEQAHQTGIVLGVGHPQRVRVTRDGALRLAFPGAQPDATLRDDVRGLGALLYLLLTGRWPLPEGPRALPAAPTAPDGSVVAPKTLQPTVPSELSNLAVRCLADNRNTVSGIRTSAAILAVLERVADDDAASHETGQIPVTQVVEPEDGSDDTVWTTRKPQRDPVRRKRLAIAIGILAIATVAILIWLVTGVIGFFSDGGSAPSGPRLTASAPAPPKQQAPPPAAPSSQAPGPVKPTDVQIFNVADDPDSPGTVARVNDGDPGTEWKTYTYKQNFPSLKPGVGIIAKFDKPVTLSQVNIDSPSEGTSVQIRTADSQDPSLGDTKIVGGGDLANGQSQLKLNDYPPTQYLIVWVNKLASNDGQYASKISEISFLSGK
ncbi:protein kinase family protein [Sciscionella sediminilitoris]|uniref:protein kinase family protein n=1 Tax=Sciscionella sediminilitoris TaxID=1445613 RepID=UPI0004DF69A7|nr:protein kinase family protein [Sciscionella sp. SE31]